MLPARASASSASPRRLRWSLSVSVLILTGLLLSIPTGFNKIVSSAIVYAPNHGKSPKPTADLRIQGGRSLRVEVGPPAAWLSAWVEEPTERPAVPLRGTVLLLHGIRDQKRSMSGLGAFFGRAGYRVVLVDLRGHGQSSGDWLSYGAVEARDLSQLLDALAAQGLLKDPVGVLGHSYGGAVAIQAGTRDPRIRAVVSVATFTSLREIVPLYVRRTLLGIGALVPDAWIRDAVEAAGRRAGFSPEEADTLAALRRPGAPVLLLHGTADRHIPIEHGHRLHAAAPQRSQLIELPGENHVSVMEDRTALLRRRALDWFQKQFAENDCPDSAALEQIHRAIWFIEHDQLDDARAVLTRARSAAGSFVPMTKELETLIDGSAPRLRAESLRADFHEHPCLPRQDHALWHRGLSQTSTSVH